MGVITLRKIWMMLLLAIVILPFSIVSAKSAEISDMYWVTRNDAPVPFVRVVLNLTAPVEASASIDKSGTTTTVKLKNTKIKTDNKSLDMNPKIVKSAKLDQNGKATDVILKTPSSIDVGDIKVFSLPKDKVNNKPDRMVIDIQQKGVAPRTTYYGSNKTTPSVAVNTNKSTPKPSATVPKKPVVIPNSTTTPVAAKVDYRTSGGIEGKIITIDPGHGGTDPGAIGPTGLMEKNVTLPISMKLKKALEAKGAKVYMTRTTDVDVYGPNASGPDELQARVDVGTRSKSDLFISVHINSFSNPSVGGIATYYYEKTQYDTRLANRIQTTIADESGFGGDRGIQPGNLYVLRRSLMPAVLVELGFISNPKEEALLKKDSVQQDFADEIASGVENYFRG